MMQQLQVATLVYATLALFAVTSPVLAATPVQTLADLQTTIETLQQVIAQREDFQANGPVQKSDADPDYFLFKAVSAVPVTVYGASATTLQYQTDGSVMQLLLRAPCPESMNLHRLYRAASCQNDTWVFSAEELNGIKTFTVPISFVASNYEKVTVEVDVFACRYNGCRHEQTTMVVYKNNQSFADKITVYDRYEWEYEWNEKIHHVQEVLLAFPHKDVRKIKLRVLCDVRHLWIQTTENDRATCSSRRTFTPPDFKRVQTDENGNVYNLRIEAVTNNIQVEDTGAMEMIFTFIGWQNQILHEVAHRPTQRDQE